MATVTIALLWLLALIVLGILAVSGELLRRRRKDYRRALGYEPCDDDVLLYRPEFGRSLDLKHDNQSFYWPEPLEADSVFVELRVRATWLGHLCDPYIEVRAGERVVRQYFERGVRGRRFVNISEFARIARAQDRLQIRGKYLKVDFEGARLHVMQVAAVPDGPMLVLAPHPDDAEIAAFGALSKSTAWVVTVTVGDGGPSKYEAFFDSEADAYFEKARTRVWDSVCIPQLGGVRAENIANLGYFDGTLDAMYDSRTERVVGRQTSISRIDILRHHPRDREPPPREATWSNLVADMQHLLQTVRPTRIVLPHPQMDPHPDHQFTAVALLEALPRANLGEGQLLFYANHLPESELYPFGPNDGVMSVPPACGRKPYYESVLSLPLSRVERLRKQIAIEAQHDLRSNPRACAPTFLQTVWEGIYAAYLHAVHANNDYVRRAARPNELFFVVRYSHADSVRMRFLAARGKAEPQTAYQRVNVDAII